MDENEKLVTTSNLWFWMEWRIYLSLAPHLKYKIEIFWALYFLKILNNTM